MYEVEIPSEQFFLKKLEEHMRDGVIIGRKYKRDRILCYKSLGGRIIRQNWYENQNKDMKCERERIVSTVAEIILEDIRCPHCFYDIDNYPIPNKFMDKAENFIPDTLKILLNKIILKNKKESESGK